jgi:hypothetical protein
MSIKRNQNGFGLVEVFLILILVSVIGFAGWYVGNRNANNKKDDKVSAQPTPQQQAAQPETKGPEGTPAQQVDDEPLIIAAVKAKNPNFANIQVYLKEIKNNFARGAAGAPDEGGFAFIAKKENGSWSVVFQGQQNPGKADGAKYGLPEGWYSTEY